MGGNLEEKILKGNIPGRYSDHFDDTARDDRSRARDSDDESVSSDDDIECDGGKHSSREASIARMSTMHGEGVPESVYRTIEARRLGAPQTGVKGVLADYKQSQALEAARRQQEAVNRQQILHRMATGRSLPGSGPAAIHSHTPPVVVPPTSDDSEDDELLEDDEFMQQFRQQRLEQMKAASISTASSSSEAPSKPRQFFGDVVDVDNVKSREALGSSVTVAGSQELFLHHLGNTNPGVVTVVHTYEPSIKLCVIVNDHLDKIAAAYPHVKFVKMMASANGVKIDPVAMPVLSIYREGECVEVLTDIAEEVIRDDGYSGGERLARSDVELVLQRFL